MDNYRELVNRIEKLVNSREIAEKICELLRDMEENKRQLRLKKQKEGIEQAKEAGVMMGRPQIEAPSNFACILEAWEKKRITAKEGARMCGMGVSTFYRRIRDIRDENLKKKDRR